MNIFVSNINYVTIDYQLQDLFSEFGEVTSCKIITDKETGRSRGFGFVEMSDEEGQQAVERVQPPVDLAQRAVASASEYQE